MQPTIAPMMEMRVRVTNELLAAKLDAMIELNESRHNENVAKLTEIKADGKEIKADVKITNGRVTKVERAVYVHWLIFTIVGSVLLVLLGAWAAKALF